jgi:hypothetical protein
VEHEPDSTGIRIDREIRVRHQDNKDDTRPSSGLVEG